MAYVVDVQNLQIMEVDDNHPPLACRSVDILIVGGGVGGVAASLAACQAGLRVCLTEETDWFGGQMTSQGVSAPDDNQYIETCGSTRTYQALRAGIRDWYRRHTRLKPSVAMQRHLNPGRAWVNQFSFEPRVAADVISGMLDPYISKRSLRLLTRFKPYALSRTPTRIRHVDFVNLDSHKTHRIKARYIIDATELGDLLALGGARFLTGGEAITRTDEPHAANANDPDDVQSFTYPFAVEWCPGESHRIPRPHGYEANALHQPYTLTLHYHNDVQLKYGVFQHSPGTHGSFWTYRRLIDARQFEDPAYLNDISMINWPGNDYRGGHILVDSPHVQLNHLRQAKDLSLGLLHWLHHEVPRDEGGLGYPEFKLRPDIMGTSDGLSKYPYIRESRRIIATKTILEQEVISNGPRAVHFADSVGIGYAPLDLHESKRNRKQVIIPTRPFQIPLGALIPQSTVNLLAGGKCIGTTHVTNGCYRLHPIEWAIGEAAGQTAAFCAELDRTPACIRDDPNLLHALQWRLVRSGAPIMWYDDLPVHSGLFEAIQMVPFELPGVLDRLSNNLHAP